MNYRYISTLVLLLFLAACSDDPSSPEQQSQLSPTETITETMEDENQIQETRECPSTHSNIGQTGELHTLAHSVSGTITIIDDCTLEITNFNFDGGGIIVEVYAGVAGDYHPPIGFALSDNIVGTAYNNQTLTVQLPENKTLDDLNGISIWCSDVGVSFGDTLLN